LNALIKMSAKGDWTLHLL